ncbi:polysaccharide deacetylase family protein [Aquipseudomonas ullengensis]|uniref:Polysaccharide deacetylase family protein n=1 Tax=Aquipseudomonas ullengensis TaxID=2759166 RepID=A0A7W4LKD1_9GAMM|nr:polysaccharide deacetylase family protein [Pseudomonas ullengensis]MBB2494705.1 polysaccharide deacetylase family protein [Pseudomonas ullengensis]
MLSSHNRYPYTPITAANPRCWPNGARLAVYFVMGVEEYNFGPGLTENLMSGMAYPDYANTSWRDYGNRVGALRLQQRFAEHEVPLSVLLNTAVYDHAPGLVEQLSAAGCELIGHGLSNSDSLAGRAREDERQYLASVSQRIQQATGKAPLGWSSPWLSQTENTVDLLAETGYGYVLDLGMDDRPVWLNSSHGRFLHIPYALELNDSSTIIGRQASASDFRQMITDQFDELLNAASDQPLVMSVVIHSFISGQPFRLRQLTQALQHICAQREQIWLTTPDQIYHSVQADPGLAV